MSAVKHILAGNTQRAWSDYLEARRARAQAQIELEDAAALFIDWRKALLAHEPESHWKDCEVET